MNSKEAAAELLKKAKFILEKDVPSAREAENHGLVVRRSQEVVELVIKAFIKSAGYEYPKVHDPSSLLLRICRDKDIDLASDTIESIQKVSSALAEQRAPAFYAERSYTPEEAEKARANATFVFETLSGFLT